MVRRFGSIIKQLHNEKFTHNIIGIIFYIIYPLNILACTNPFISFFKKIPMSPRLQKESLIETIINKQTVIINSSMAVVTTGLNLVSNFPFGMELATYGVANVGFNLLDGSPQTIRGKIAATVAYTAYAATARGTLYGWVKLADVIF